MFNQLKISDNKQEIFLKFKSKNLRKHEHAFLSLLTLFQNPEFQMIHNIYYLL